MAARSNQPQKAEYGRVETAEPDVSTVLAVSGIPMIQVDAPANLPEGYSFEAEISGQRFTVVVPPGGVEEGQSFTVPGYPPSAPSKSGPVGAWRDDLCSCCVYGICHPHLCLAWCFSPLALAQVMVRMRLNWCGGHDTLASSASTFKRVLILSIGYVIFMHVLPYVLLSVMPPEPTGMTDDTNSTPNFGPMYAFIGIVKGCQLAFWIYMMIAIIRTRQAVRSKFAIPEQCCPGCEDALCAICCGCCTIMQMSRHTADYETYAAQCCTEDGLPSHVDATV